MTAIHFTLFLLAYFGTAVTICIGYRLLKPGEYDQKGLLLLVVLGLVLSVVIGSQVVVGENFVVRMASEILALSRTFVTALALGVCCALPLALIWRHNDTETPLAKKLGFVFSLFGVLGTLLFGGLLAGKDVISPYLPNPGAQGQGGIATLVDKGFVIEDVLDTEIIPIRVAIDPDGKVFVSGHYGIAAQSGAVIEISQDDKGVFKERFVAKMLNRPYGLHADRGRLYVSRSGQFTRWEKGKAKHTFTGAVTMLKDLDGDGIMDYYHDVITGLPGAQGPDYLHQNNDVTVGPDGSVYVTTAIHSDGLPSRHKWEGVILKASGDGLENVEIFATGVRNAFGLEFGPDQQLFATDNDSQSGPLAGQGDKFVHVTKNSNFGHPYADERSPAVSPVALRSSFALAGLTYATSDNLPAPYKGSMFVVSYGEGRIMRVELEKKDETYGAKLVPFAIVPGAVDVAAAPNGDFYVAVYPDKVVRIRQVQN
jgi:glucose/arabinose dehydrogenase